MAHLGLPDSHPDVRAFHGGSYAHGLFTTREAGDPRVLGPSDIRDNR